jgi:hypothetical protein
MFVTRISRYILRSVLSAVSRNRGRSYNVLPVDTGAQLYSVLQLKMFQEFFFFNQECFHFQLVRNLCHVKYKYNLMLY